MLIISDYFKIFSKLDCYFLMLVLELVEMILHNQTTKTDCWNSKNVVTHNSQCPLHLVTSFPPHWIVIFPGGRDHRLYLVSLLYTPLRTYSLDFTAHLSSTENILSRLISQLPHQVVFHGSLVIFFSSWKQWTLTTTYSFLDSLLTSLILCYPFTSLNSSLSS